ncbi:MAG: hypothetical protein M1832_005297 [Thelocarpon impressellum]|nr:MAG: hypothetical protein M1832_005297 [Thelocarpon impressellum]
MANPPLRIAVLECDTPLPGTSARYNGGYGAVFRALLHAAALRLDDAALLSPERGLDVSTWQVQTHPESYPKLADVDGVLVTGSRYCSFDDDAWILTLVDFVKTVLAQERARIVGVCFGHQIVGRALGAPLGRNEAGWENLHQMHRDALLSPPPASSLPHTLALGATPKCATQGLYAPGRLLTVQGHPEFSEPVVREILEDRHKKGIFTDEVYEDALSRVGRAQDGVVVGEAFLRFLRE